MKSKNQDDFDTLKAEWYTKLKKDGFEDIEQSDGFLKVWHSSLFSRSRNHNKSHEHIYLCFEAKQEYFRLAGQFLHNYKFKSERAKKLWAYHVEGLPYREIANKLGYKTESAAQYMIRKLAKIMLAQVKKERENNEQE